MVSHAQAEGEEPGSGFSGFSALSILRTIWKRKIRITVAWILFALCAAAVVRSLPTVYLAETVVLIDSQKIPEKFVSATVGDDLEERIASIRQMLLSGAELKKVIEEFGLYREERKTHFEEEILEMMRKDIAISLESAMPGSSNKTKRPGAFRIGYQGGQPAVVMQVANRLTDLYVEQNLRTREGQAAGTSDFLDTQLREAKKHLDELEAAVSTYKLAHNGELPQQEAALSGTLSRLQIELEANRDAINRAQQTKVILEGSANAMEATIAAQTREWELALRGEATPGTSLLLGPWPAAQQEGSARRRFSAQGLFPFTRLRRDGRFHGVGAALQDHLGLLGAVDGITIGFQFDLKPGKGSGQSGLLLRQFSIVREFVSTDRRFQFVEMLLGLAKLRVQEVRSTGRLPLSRPQVLFHVEVRQTVRNLHHHRRLASLITDPKGPRPFGFVTAAGHGGLQGNGDVLPHHLQNFFLEMRFSFFPIEPELLDHLLQLRAAKKHLPDGSDAFLQVVADRRRNELLRDLLRVDQYHRLRQVHRRQRAHHGGCAESEKDPRHGDTDLSFPDRPENGEGGEPGEAGFRLFPVCLSVADHVFRYYYGAIRGPKAEVFLYAMV